MRCAIAIVCALGLAACASNGGVTEVEEAEPVPHDGPVCIMRPPIPASVPHEVLLEDELDVETFGRGSDDEAFGLLADDAREVGANLVAKARTGRAMGILIVAQTGATGVAIKVTDFEAFDCAKYGGRLF